MADCPSRRYPRPTSSRTRSLSTIFGTPGEEVQRFLDGQIQHFMNILAAIADLEDLRLVARAFAFFTDQLHVGEELHFHRNRTVALAGFATAAGNIEREMPGGEAALFRFRQRRKQIADRIEGLDVGDGIRPRSPSDGRLIDQNDLVDEIVAFQFSPTIATAAGVPLVCFFAADNA